MPADGKEGEMKRWSDVNEALDFAISNEEEAYRFYTDLGGRAERPWMREVFAGFAKEELGHKAKLEGVRRGKELKRSEKSIVDLKIGDYLVDVQPTGELSYPDALVLAMKKEKAAFRLYTDIAAATEEGPLRELFLALAQEEAKHKLRFEVEYDEIVLREN
jgi:rubrerythrin